MPYEIAKLRELLLVGCVKPIRRARIDENTGIEFTPSKDHRSLDVRIPVEDVFCIRIRAYGPVSDASST